MRNATGALGYSGFYIMSELTILGFGIVTVFLNWALNKKSQNTQMSTWRSENKDFV